MSQYHKDCAPPGPAKKQKKPKPMPVLQPKAFCDCNYCECQECPDILKMLSITVTDTTCIFGSSKGNIPRFEHLLTQRQSLLDVLSPDRDCDCEVMARAVRSNVHMNLGLTQRRDEINLPTSNSTTSNADSSENPKLPK